MRVSGSVEPLAVTDMTSDPLTAQLPSTRELGARRYVGVPVVRADGSLFGTLCGLDPRAGETGRDVIAWMSVLARIIAFQFDRDDAVARDLEAERQRRESAESALVDAQKFANFEQQLIGIVGHDLKNPLTAIRLGATTLLRRPDLDNRAEATLTRILSSADRAGRLVGDILDFTQVRLGGGIPLHRAPVDLVALTQQIVDEVVSSAASREITVTAHTAVVEANVDSDRIAQVLSNLLSNALTYGARDKPVRVTLRRDALQVTILVANEGTPIPPHMLRSIFEPMRRATAAAAPMMRSVGLGLFIVDHLVRAHGGDVSVQSDSAETVFCVVLPL